MGTLLAAEFRRPRGWGKGRSYVPKFTKVSGRPTIFGKRRGGLCSIRVINNAKEPRGRRSALAECMTGRRRVGQPFFAKLQCVDFQLRSVGRPIRASSIIGAFIGSCHKSSEGECRLDPLRM